jgi:Zn-dependent M28 family amino/carboxypeptidase
MEGDDESGQMNVIPGVTTKLIMTGREVAEHLLEGTGKTLADLQNKIDRELKPGSFLIPDKKVTIQARVEESCLEVPNIIGYLEGSDPEYKHEVVVYSAHFDHLGSRNSEQIFNGADDNASGSTALLELAEAYTMLRQKPKRSILFLWVSGEEIGLFGSRFYSNNPVIPLENTLVDINLDMVGRVKTDADTGSSVFMTDRETVFVIGGHQSIDLREINNKVFEKMRLTPDYSLGDLDHPDRLYYRSDHFNFARNDVPALFFTTGLHADYHTIRDTYDRIDFEKFLAVTRLAFMVGYEVANRTERIEVDNPFSSWEQ